MIFDRLALYTSRNSGLFTTEFICDTCDQARDRCSFESSKGNTKLFQVGVLASAVRVDTSARLLASNCSIAGLTCSGLISAKRGRPEKSNKGFMVIFRGNQCAIILAAKTRDSKP